jgi:tetratricopeptide (TPR) repeat protein
MPEPQSSKRLRMLCGFLVLLLAGSLCLGQEVEERAQRRDQHLNRGYALLREGQREAAQQQFELALGQDPEHVPTLKQLGYLSLEQGNLLAAAASFEAAHRLAPDDFTLALQLGYIYDRLHEPAKAQAAFRAALASPEPQVRLQAATALKNIARAHRAWYFDVFAQPVYLARFSNGIAMVETRLGWRPQRDLPVSFYLGTRLTRDTRSVGGALPIVFSDDVGLFGVGVLLQPKGSHFSAYAEANLAVSLLRRPGVSDAQSDFRAVAAYFRRWDGRLWGPLGWAGARRLEGERLFSDLDASLGYYSRYHHNVIAYLQMREGVRLPAPRGTQLFAYLKYNLAKDSRRDFYNNLGEGGAGLEFRPSRHHNLGFRLEYLRGAYLGMARDPNPYRPNYNDLRFYVLYGRRF